MQEYRAALSKCVVVVVLMSLAAAPAFPQAGNGSVRGTVRDQSDAVIPGAAVKLTNTATNLTSETTTNEAGFYVFPVVVPGPYELTVEAPGLGKFQANITVQTQQSATLDAQLKVATEATTMQRIWCERGWSRHSPEAL